MAVLNSTAFVGVTLILAAAVAPAGAQSTQRFEACTVDEAKYTADQTISACTAKIEQDKSRPELGTRWISLNESYSSRGHAWMRKGDYDRAIADFNEAIRHNPLDYTSYEERGEALRANGDLDRAIADYGQTIRIRPEYFLAYSYRGDAWLAKGDFKRAIADYDQAIKIAPKEDREEYLYMNRAIAFLNAGAFPKALADVASAADSDAYKALWVEIINRRGNLPSQLAEATKRVDMTKWPAPIIRLFLGQSNAAAVLAAADDPRPTIKRASICVANFFTAELALQQGRKDEATRLFGLVVAGCDMHTWEYEGANTELNALRASR